RRAEAERSRHDADRERHRLELELARAQRIETVGRLARGVAHDVNNLLGIILNYARVAAKQVEEDSQIARDIAHIEHAAREASNVTKKLLSLRADAGEPQVVDVNAALVEATDLITGTLAAQCSVEVSLASEPCLVDI